MKYTIEECTTHLREAERIKNAPDVKLWHKRLSDAVKMAAIPSIEEALDAFRSAADKRTGDVFEAYEVLKQSVRAEQPTSAQAKVPESEVTAFFASVEGMMQ